MTAILPAPVSIRIGGGDGAPRRARISVRSRLDGHVSDTSAADAVLIVSELVTNSVLHANVDSDHALTVELMRIDDRLRITVIDAGSLREPRIRPPDHRTPGGLGLCIVAQLSSAWGFTRDEIGTTRVWCDLLLDHEMTASAPAA